MREGIVLLFFALQLLGEELELALELAVEEKVDEDVVVLFVELVLDSDELEEGTVLALLLVEHVEGVQELDAGGFVEVHPRPHEVADSKGDQVDVLGLALVLGVLGGLLDLPGLNEEVDQLGDVLLHEFDHQRIHLGGHDPRLRVALDVLEDLLVGLNPLAQKRSLEGLVACDQIDQYHVLLLLQLHQLPVDLLLQ